MEYKTVILEKKDGIAILTLNRPEKLNAVNQEMRSEISGILEDLERDEGIRVVVFTGAGRGFCAGADIGEFRDSENDPELQNSVNENMFRMAERIYSFEKPTIGAINGVAAGDGAQWVLAFDLNVASEKAKFGWTATAIGLL